MAKNRTASPGEAMLLRKSKAASSVVTTTENIAPTWDRFGGQFEGILDADGTITDLPTLAAEYLALSEQTKQLDARKAEIRKLIDPIMQQVNEAAICGDFFLVSRYETKTPTKISESKLLNAGVDLDTIEAAREGGLPYFTTRIIAAEAE